MYNALHTESEVSKFLKLTDEEKQAIKALQTIFPMKVSEQYLALIDAKNPDDPLRRIVVPSLKELRHLPKADKDDVHKDEAKYQPCPGIIHRYPGKLLFIPTLSCASHCRFCFRKGKKVKHLSNTEGQEALNYIKNNTSIRDVIITGGDPFCLDDKQIEYYLSSVRANKHVEIIRLTTRFPIYFPSRITDNLVNMLAKYRPVFVIFSFMHPRELTSEIKKGIKKMADAGLVMLQQGPILRGVNDKPETLKKLYQDLAALQVMPYYVTWGIHAPGTEHFITDGKKACSIVSALENKTSGFCIPHLSTIAKGDKVRMIGWSPDKENAHLGV